jgi:hypothetical protein
MPPNAKGAFNQVYDRAQAILRTKFGMELFELRGKLKGTGMEETQMETQQTQQTQAQTQRKKGRTSRLDAIEEEEEDEDEDGADEGSTQAAAQAIKRECKTLACLLNIPDRQSLARKRILSDRYYRPRLER